MSVSPEGGKGAGRFVAVQMLVMLLGGAAAASSLTNAPAPAPRPPALWFPVEEELLYQLRWGVLPIGQARSTAEWVQDGSQLRLRIRYRARTNRLFAKIYPINDSAEALIDPADFLPLSFTIRMARRRQLTDETITFDHAGRLAVWESRVSGKRVEFPIAADTRDLVTQMYYLRANGLGENTNLNLRIAVDDRLYDVGVKTRNAEEVKLPRYGRVRSLRLMPEVNFKGLVIEGGTITLWVSQDARRVATRLVVDAPLANVSAVLCRVTGAGRDSWILGKKAQVEETEELPEDQKVDLNEAVPQSSPEPQPDSHSPIPHP